MLFQIDFGSSIPGFSDFSYFDLLSLICSVGFDKFRHSGRVI